MLTEVVDAPVVFDPTAVHSLTGHADDLAFAAVFVTRYRGLLPERVRRIATALTAAEVDDVMDAVLSLKVSSATVGTLELAGLAAAIERMVRAGDLVAARVAVRTLARAAERADRALGAFLAG